MLNVYRGLKIKTEPDALILNHQMHFILFESPFFVVLFYSTVPRT